MVDVGDKEPTRREAEAEARVVFPARAFARLLDGDLPKGGVVEPARLAGIQAAKRTADLVPLCHPLPLEEVAVEIEPLPAERALRVRCRARATARTGVEMEAMCGAAGAALTVYDMTKALDKGIRIQGLRLLRKSGGRSGPWRHNGAS
ncbi:MAG: cyclic pyranopterin monophosphate synthase MoaC [Planctomycetota bacterium]|nr:MAG: cyclic pyranopterin monophosphate synthase MoaC [Planctomycetota bacterium]